MRPAHPLEQTVGMAYYASDANGAGGHIRHEPGDFRVREIEAVETEPASADPGDYPHLVLRVELTGWDTNDFAGTLADRLGISRERVSWAGTKDKHAVTTQLFSVEGIDPGAVPEVSGAEVTVVGRTGRPVLFGDLLGNEFEIVVRDVERPAAVDEVTAQLRAFGRQDPESDDARVAVPNFFGQQRFGSRRPVTHEVGLAIVRRDWEGAVMAYVGSPHEREPEETREARSFVESSRDWQAALDRFPNHLGFERAMLHRLDERTDGGEVPPTAEDYQAALRAVPENIQQLFVHAAQSVLFNRILSRRMQRGLPFLGPVEGDVVCFADEASTDELVVPDADRSQAVTADRLDTVRRHCERNRAVVTAPLIGTETTLASGEPGEIEREVLEEADLAPEDFDLPEPFHSSGARRAIAVRTDVDVSRDPLTVAFALPKGSYATVLLREYLKVDPERL